MIVTRKMVKVVDSVLSVRAYPNNNNALTLSKSIDTNMPNLT